MNLSNRSIVTISLRSCNFATVTWPKRMSCITTMDVMLRYFILLINRVRYKLSLTPWEETTTTVIWAEIMSQNFKIIYRTKIKVMRATLEQILVTTATDQKSAKMIITKATSSLNNLEWTSTDDTKSEETIQASSREC